MVGILLKVDNSNQSRYFTQSYIFFLRMGSVLRIGELIDWQIDKLASVGATGPIHILTITPSSSSFLLKKNITFITSVRHMNLTNKK